MPVFLLLPFILQVGREASDDWTPLDINIDLDDELGGWVRPLGPPQPPGLWRVPCVRTYSRCCLIPQSI